MIDIVTPVDEGRSLAWAILAMNYAFEVPARQIIQGQDEVTAQDLPIVESQRPELLPLDLQAELHLRSDRTANPGADRPFSKAWAPKPIPFRDSA